MSKSKAELGSLKEAEVELDDNSSAALLLPASRNATGRIFFCERR